MVERVFAIMLVATVAFSAVPQDPEFAATPPAKVLLDLGGTTQPEPEVAPVPAVPTETTPEDAPPQEEPIAPAKPVVDTLIAETGALMAEQDAAEQAPASPQTTAATAQEALSSPMKTVGRSLVALCATLAAFLLIVAAAKRWGRKTPLLAGQQLARVIGRVGLSPQASLHFVQTNGEVLVIGVTQHNVSLIRTFDASDFETPAEVATAALPARAADPATNFLTQLKESRATMGVEAVVDEDLDQLKGELQRLKQYFQDNRS